MLIVSSRQEGADAQAPQRSARYLALSCILVSKVDILVSKVDSHEYDGWTTQ